MDKKRKVVLSVTLVAVGILLVSLVLAGVTARGKPACNDGLDNDLDGYRDWPSDPGCLSKNDASELNLNVQCDDGTDNDGDTFIDYPDDWGCTSPTDNDETNCGDMVCEGGETQASCPQDCGFPDSCSETDGGNVIAVFGTTSGYYNNNQYSHGDYCVNLDDVMEYYCSSGYEQSMQQSCGADSYGSPYCSGNSVYKDHTDYFCVSGACGSSTTPELVEACVSPQVCSNGQCVIQDSCSDTDGGFFPQTLGTVSGYLDQQYFSSTDLCLDTTAVLEYYCSGSHKANVSISCGDFNLTACSNGACI